MTRHVGSIALVSLCLLDSVAGSLADPASLGRTVAEMEQEHAKVTLDAILDWLPTDSETLVVVRGPFRIPGPRRHDETISLKGELEAAPILLLRAMREGIYAKALKGQKVALAVEGSRAFRAPKNLGLMPFEGCQVIVFQQDLDRTGDELSKSLKAGASEVITSGEQIVYRFDEKLEDDKWSIFITRPLPSVLMVATDRAYLEELLTRMKQKANSRAFPASLPEWKHVNLNARFWAIRHYDAANSKTDPSSPLAIDKRAWSVRDPKAIGLVFDFDPAPKNTARVIYLSGSPRAREIAVEAWNIPHEGLKPSIQERQAGVVEITVDANDNKVASFFHFAIITALGHGIYL